MWSFRPALGSHQVWCEHTEPLGVNRERTGAYVPQQPMFGTNFCTPLDVFLPGVCLHFVEGSLHTSSPANRPKLRGAATLDNFYGPDITGFQMNLTFSPTTQSDADLLASIRIAAMRESLERLGRFNPQRARERFLASFDPALCRFIEADGVRVGCFLVRPQPDHWHLGHLYIVPEHQARGIGATVLRQIIADADSQRMPIRLGALRGSESNRFYQRHGFEQTDEAEWDIYYLRQPSATQA